MNGALPLSHSSLEPSSEAAPPPLVCRDLRKSFSGRTILKGVDLSLPVGSVVGLVGTNGSGKSTLIKCLLGLLKPTGGSAFLFGENPWWLSAASKARLGYVPQVVQLYPWMTVAQIVSYTAAFYDSWDEVWAQTLLNRMELPGAHRVGTLSTGQQQKLALVLAFGHRPELLILDEPVASLDPIARRELLKSIMELTLDNRHTVLFSTHITSDLERVATHVAFLRNGKIALFDELDAVKDRVKRVRIRAAHTLPSRMDLRGLLRYQVNGNQALLAVADWNDALLSEIRLRFQAELQIEDLNLEDIFVELHTP